MQVLIFSQFKIMLNVIEDSLNLCKYPYERIDGSVAGRERQQAIDRFSKGKPFYRYYFARVLQGHRRKPLL